jgi:hypothetical protein
MSSTSTKKRSGADDHKMLADAYRQACYDLLRAARTLRDVTGEIAGTRVKVAPSAMDDLTEAWGILRELQSVAVSSGQGWSHA